MLKTDTSGICASHEDAAACEEASMRTNALVGTGCAILLPCLVGLLVTFHGCDAGVVGGNGRDDGGSSPGCPAGEDKDGDGYGKGCPAGPDCDDADAFTHPGAQEICDGKDNNCDGKIDEGVLRACGTCDPGCTRVGQSGGFPLDPTKDPSLKESDGLGLDPNGDLVLDRKMKQYNYLWIANTFDTRGAKGGCVYAIDAKYNTANDSYCRGTVSKVDTVGLKEVARYFTVTCTSKTGATGCMDVNGKPINRNFPHAPSRTAVDFNFDVWVANRAFGGQPSATKIANDPADCVDRNKNGKIDTSNDRDGDGKINVDCDGNGEPDTLSTVCTGALAGKPPEFLGEDDECVLFTVNYGDVNDYGRSICLDSGKATVGASAAWVGTFNHPGNNRFFKINGTTGQIEATVNLPAGHSSYGCTADGHNVIWSTHGVGTLAYFRALPPYEVGPLLTSPKASLNPGVTAYHYGIATNADGHIWLGGSNSCRMLRYKPDRASFGTLASGKWTLFHVPCPGDTAGAVTTTRGVAPDARGKVWLALTSGYIVRVDQSLPDGEHDLSKSSSIWPTAAKGVIGVGVDFNGNIWGIGYSNAMASRLDVDGQGNVTSSVTKDVPVGLNPYTYSDFTGFGLMTFVRPQGRYVYQVQPCAGGKKAKWKKVVWNATVPAGTAVTLRARSGDSDATMGNYVGPYTASPAVLEQGPPAPLGPNPSLLLEVEFTLKSNGADLSPVLHDFDVTFDCNETPA
jgi:hypothetical protein